MDRRWSLKNPNLLAVRNLVNSYTERELAPLRLWNAFIWFSKLLWRKQKTGFRFWVCLETKIHRLLSADAPVELAEELAPLLISHMLELISVITSDFVLMKHFLDGVDLSNIEAHELNARLFVDNNHTKMERALDGLISEEVKVQKADDLDILIWRARTSTLDHLMTGFVCRLGNHPQPLDSLERLRRIQQCLHHVLCLARDFILTQNIFPVPEPQPPSFSIAELSPDPLMYLVKQQVFDALQLIDLVYDGLTMIGEYDLGNLGIDRLQEVRDMVSKINTTLEERAFAEVGEYQDKASMCLKREIDNEEVDVCLFLRLCNDTNS